MSDLKKIENALRYGGSLSHGRAHTEDHKRWSRRDFLSGLGMFGTGAFLLGSTPVRAGISPLLHQIDKQIGNRILVLIQLKGGNDGLNTVVPFNDDRYYNLRPSIAIDKSDASAFSLSSNLGMHPGLAPLQSVYGDGQMVVVQNVGYPNPTLSHFRSTDIWQTATDHDVIRGTGWLGRYLDVAYPSFIEQPPERPLAVQIGSGSAQLFNGPNGNMGMQLFSNEFLQRLTNGELYDQNAVPNTKYGGEMAFVRSITNNSFRYAEAVGEAAIAGDNVVDYPSGEGKLDTHLATVARLIKGGLGAKIYHVSLQGFDTHAGQVGPHQSLMSTVANSVTAFLQDMQGDPTDTEVLTLTYSEFGRRAEQNGSGGTDHGEAAPLFLFGPGVKGGLIGGVPDLRNTSGGNVPHVFDFRDVYASILQDWFGFSNWVINDALFGYSFEKLSFIEKPSPVETGDGEQPEAFQLSQNYPNPFNPVTTIRYTIANASVVRLEVFDVQGKRVRILEDQLMPAGEHEIQFDAGQLPSGTYIYRLQTRDGVLTKKMVLIR